MSPRLFQILVPYCFANISGPNIIQQCFCTPDGYTDPIFQMRYVSARGEYCHTRLHLGFSVHLRILQDSIYNVFWHTNNTHKIMMIKDVWRVCEFFQCCVVSPPQLFPSSTKYVRCPGGANRGPPYWHPVQKICEVSPPPGIHFLCLKHFGSVLDSEQN